MNAILFNKDGTTRIVENVTVSTYLSVPVYVDPLALTGWQQTGKLPCSMETYDKKRYIKEIESKDYAVFTEE